MLRLFGAQLGKHVHVYPTTRIMIPWNLTVGHWSTIGASAEIYNLGPITIGNNVTISQRAHLCAGTHDHNDPDLPMIKSTIQVKDKAWICADAFVGPGVTIFEGAVLGARAVAVKDIGAWCVAVGNPAVVKGHRKLEMASADPFDEK